MDGERISLRLEPEDLELIDAFVSKHPEFSNRSHLARLALRAFIQKDEGPATRSEGNSVTIIVPDGVIRVANRLIQAGRYIDMEDALSHLVREAVFKKEDDDRIRTKVVEEDEKTMLQTMDRM